MEEVEIPLEGAMEELHKAAHGADHGGEHSSGAQWLRWAALASAILAALAAVAAMLSGHYANDAMLEQIKASDGWSYYQAKGIKSALTDARIESLGASANAEVLKRLNEKSVEYKHQQKEIEEKTHELEAESQAHLRAHETLARAVTFFQVAIAVAAVSVLARKRRYFMASLGFGAVGMGFLIQGLLMIFGKF